MLRPREVVLFEGIMFGTLILGLLQSSLAWDELVALASPAKVITIKLATFAVLAALTLLVSRRRSNFAKWVLVGVFALGLPAVAKLASEGLLLGSGMITAIQLFGQLVAYALLFTPAARAWLGRKPATG